MLGSVYYDSYAAIQVLGCLLNNPSIMETKSCTLRRTDFANDFHKVIAESICILIEQGATNINTKMIEDSLKNKEKKYAIYKINNGAEWLHEAFVSAEITNFDFFYQKLKKMTLLRTYDDLGIDVSWIYDPNNLTDLNKKQDQIQKLEQTSISDLAEMIENKVCQVRAQIIENDVDESCQIGENIDELLIDLSKSNVKGQPLFDVYLDEIALGARPGCFYLRSGSTGTGKSRTSMADACYLACDTYWDVKKNDWVSIGVKQPTMFISVELDIEELQTMALSFVSGVSENKIIKNEYDNQEEIERVKKAANILKESELYLEYFPDYSMRDIENCIKRNLYTHHTTYIFFDYLTSSMKIIEEITAASNGMKIREDQVLFLLSSKLKEIASSRGVFIMSSTQINGSFKHEKILDQTMLAGAKAIANRVDLGAIMVDTTQEDMDALQPLFDKHPEICRNINMKMSVYKNRRGQYNRIILWMVADKSTCRYVTKFVTTFDFEWVDVKILPEKKGGAVNGVF